MPTALLVTADFGGNLPPLLGTGEALVRRGWDVVVHADDGVTARAADAGLETVPAATAGPHDPRLPRTLLQSLRDVPRAWADRVRGRDAVAAARRIGADVAVVDVLLVGTIAELTAAGVPTVVVAHSTWEGVRTFLGGPLGLRLRGLGAPPARVLAGADRILVATHPRLGRPVRMPENAVVVGPVLQEEPVRREPAGRPLVLLSLSTVAFPGQAEALQRILDGLAPLPVDVRASRGGVPDDVLLRPGPNTTMTRLLDHRALLPEAAMVVSHGGHATAVRALAHGVPLLLVPMHPLMDQPRIARAVAAAGAGAVLPKSAAPGRVRTSAERLLRDPAARAAAAALGAELVAADGAGRAAREIDEVAGAAAHRARRSGGPVPRRDRASRHSRPVRLQASSESSPPESSSK